MTRHFEIHCEGDQQEQSAGVPDSKQETLETSWEERNRIVGEREGVCAGGHLHPAAFNAREHNITLAYGRGATPT